MVFIEATGAVRVDGVISAAGGNGGSSGGTFGGGGSGGSLYIRCATFQGAPSGELTVEGGGPSAAAPGAGGRLAIHYDPAQQALLPVPEVTFRARPGGNILRADAMGSLYLTDATWVSAPFQRFDGVWFHGDWATNWTCPGDLAPAASIGFGPENVAVTVGGDVRLDGVAFGLAAGGQLHCQNLSLSNSASLSVFSAYVPLPAPTLSTPLYGALVSVSNLLSLATNTWIYPISLVRPFTGISNTNALAPLFRAAHIRVAPNAGFHADRFGHPTASSRTINSWGNGAGAGSGRGYGTYTGSYGGSHGGLGINAVSNRLYGSRLAPVFPGSGGGGGWTGGGAAGGGAIRLQASDTVVLDGTLTADAGLCQGQGSGGAGGSILVLARAFLPGPNALLSARGSDGDSDKGGGGGRIAVGVGLSSDQIAALYATGQLPTPIAFHNADSLQGRFLVDGGVNGGEGTATWFFIPRGSFLLFR